MDAESPDILLVADPSDPDLKFWQKNLTEWGFVHQTAEEDQALLCLETLSPLVLLISNHKAPDQFLKILRHRRQEENDPSPVMIFGGSMDATSIATLQAAGASACIPQSASNQEVQASLTHWHNLSQTNRSLRLRIKHLSEELQERNEELHDLKSRLHQALKLESLGKAAGGIAHDLNNILTPIMGLTDVSLEYGPDQLDLIKSNLTSIKTATKRGKSIIGQLLTFDKKGILPEEPAESLAQIIDEVLNLLSQSMPANIVTHCHVDVKGLPTIPASQVHEIITNLVKNAVQAMGDTGGRLTIEFTAFTAGAKERKQLGLRQENYAKLEVRDTGNGIPSHILPKIFEPFFTTKSNGEGTGLGLTMLQSILKAAGGAIEVKSQQGKGTSFFAYLPLKQQPAPLPKAPKLKKSASILVVDDEVAVLKMLEQMLVGLGYRVTEAPDGPTALNLAASQSFDLVITDRVMPFMSGFELAELLKETSGAPVILCSGMMDVPTEEQLKSLGFSGFLSKPFYFKNVRQVVEAALTST